MNTKIILMANNKGGVGKTSSVAAIGDVLARKMGKKVLLIDADPQGNLSRRFGYGVATSVRTTLEVFLQSEYIAKQESISSDFSPSLFFNEAILRKPRSKMANMKTCILCVLHESYKMSIKRSTWMPISPAL